MRLVVPTRAFIRDTKKLARQQYDIQRLKDIVSLLRENRPLPAQAYPHKLSGEWDGAWECHIANDWLLIYSYTPDTLTLLRTGSHKDLFSWERHPTRSTRAAKT